MAYLPQTEEVKVEKYRPGSLEIPKEFLPSAPATSIKKENDAPKFEPSLPKEQVQPAPKQESKVEMPLKDRWDYLRRERNARLAATDYVNTGMSLLTLEQKADLYAYRTALRELTVQPGAPWSPEAIPWPTRPVTG